MRQATAPARTERWDDRIYGGLRVASVPADARAALGQALGVLGVEAEHFMLVLREFSARTAAPTCTRADGDRFLWQLEASALRLTGVAEPFEVAAQTYLAALENAHPELRLSPAEQTGAGVVWWPPAEGGSPPGLPLELGLRRCGYAYRHVVAARLATNVEEVAEQLSLILHALRTLPPAGILPATTLYGGIYELAAMFHGHLVPHHLADLRAESPGLLSGIQLLRQLDATEDHTVEADLAWARAQLQELRQAAAQAPAVPAERGRRGLAGLFHRGPRAAPGGAQAWAERAEREWQETITALEAIRAGRQPKISPILPR